MATAYSTATPPNLEHISKPPPYVRAGLVERRLYFPESILKRIEHKPGDLVELLTMLLSDHLKGGAK